MKRGISTSEFWFASITAVVVAVIGILVGYKMLTQEQADLWITLAVAIIPVALAAISYGYGQSRAGVKEAHAFEVENRERWNELERVKKDSLD